MRTARPPQLGDFVRFAHPIYGGPSGYIIMIITEVGQPTRCEVMVRHGNCGGRTYHWRRADELTLLAHARPENRRYLRYPVRHRDEPACDTF
jgi:hypothetical protein